MKNNEEQTEKVRKEKNIESKQKNVNKEKKVENKTKSKNETSKVEDKSKTSKAKTIKSNKAKNTDKKETEKLTTEQSETVNKDTRKVQFKDTCVTNETSEQKEKGQKQNEKQKQNEEKDDKEEQSETVNTESITESLVRSEETNKPTTTTVEGFPFTETEETPHYFDDSTEFDIKDMDFDVENYQKFVRHLLFSDRERTHTSDANDAASADHPVDQQVVQALEVELFKKFQETQEERIIFEVGNTQWHTSKVTARADPNSLFAMLFRKGCPFRPSTSNGRPTYFFDRDPAHFRFILNYLRNGAMVQEGTLPRERRYLSELLSEVRFYRLRGLEEAILARLEHCDD